MVKSEVTKMLTVLTKLYPGRVEVDEIMATVWTSMLSDLPYEVAQKAVEMYSMTNKFPPTIADIREAALMITNPQLMVLDAGEAWGEVVQAIRKYGSYGVEQALASMSDRTREVVRRIGFYDICMADESSISVIRGQFMKMYNTLGERERKQAVLTPELKVLVSGVGNLALEGSVNG